MAEVTNGITEITIGGKTYPLRFGLAAVREMARRSSENLTPNDIKVFTDLVYSGMMNFAIGEDLPFPKYGEVYTLVEEFTTQEDFSQQAATVWEVFQQSRFGAEWIEKVDEVKKKAMELARMAENPIGTDSASTASES